MTTEISAETYSDYAVHPGEFLRDEIEFIGMTPRDLAERMGRPTHVVDGILNCERSVTAEIAADLERALGIPAYMWTRSQARYEQTIQYIAERGKRNRAV